ncbi:hypothetical protein Vadar_017725 [Vaccinium darrowii]|uniref:Uncharacterized protein n=1 Tax=Vaccinium darrowii TaxID=229202 RepID=A0ACB7XB19_9ERIC|nr:hypothetical protein Vadar_017725 [Vaccinium darrowii]
MAGKQTSTNSNVCEKIYKAICPLSSKVTSSAPIDQKKPTDKAVSTEVPVNFNTSLSPAPSKLDEVSSVEKNGQVVKVASRNEPVKTKLATAGVTVPEKAKPLEEEGNGNDKFSSYIDRSRAKLRATSNIGTGNGGGVGGGGGKSLLRRDTFHDRVSDYINRAKNKIRSNSNLGGRSVSIK